MLWVAHSKARFKDLRLDIVFIDHGFQTRHLSHTHLKKKAKMDPNSSRFYITQVSEDSHPGEARHLSQERERLSSRDLTSIY